MILISAGLVLAAVVLLIAGFVLAKPFLIMWSIVVSVLSALFLVIGAFLRRNELFPGGGQAAAPATPPKGLAPPALPYGQTGPMAHQPPPAQPQPQPRPQPGPAQRAATVSSPAPAPRRPAASGIAADAIVLVIPGRKRYHVAGCRQLTGRDHEELTYEEAREEGFTPCTTCLPDAALGGRQLPPAADPEPAVSAFTPESRPESLTAEGRSEGRSAESRSEGFTAESRAEGFSTESRGGSSGETRDLRPPVSPPKPGTPPGTPSATKPGTPPKPGTGPGTPQKPGAKAATDGPEPAAREEGAAAWFGRPSAPPAGPAKTSSSAAESDDEADAQTSYFRPPPFAHRSESPADPKSGTGPAKPGTAGKPEEDKPGAKPGTAGGTKPGQPGAKPGQPSGKPAATPESGRPGQSGGKAGEASGATGGPADGAAGGSGAKPGQAGSKPEQTGAKSGQPGGKPGEATGKPGTAGSKAEAGSKSGQAGGRPGQGAGAAGRSGEDDDSSGPATAPQPRVPASATPGGPGPSGGSGKPSQHPSGTGKEPPSSGGETVILHQRPASSAESEAKPKGPLPTGAPTRPSGIKPPVPPAKPETTRSESSRPESAKGGPAKGEPAKGEAPKGGAAAKNEGSGAKSGDEPGSMGKGERRDTVKVIVGTRRYHSTACPLIRGAGDSGVETMTLAAAEAAGLTSCSVCQHDRETVG